MPYICYFIYTYNEHSITENYVITDKIETLIKNIEESYDDAILLNLQKFEILWISNIMNDEIFYPIEYKKCIESKNDIKSYLEHLKQTKVNSLTHNKYDLYININTNPNQYIYSNCLYDNFISINKKIIH